MLRRAAVIIVASALAGGLGGLIAQTMQSWWCLVILIPLGSGMGIGAAFLAAEIEVNSDR